jgi:hypothetical protein
MNKFTLFLAVIVALSFFASCGTKSVKGKWTDADKATIKANTLGVVKAGKYEPAIADDVLVKITDCTVTKLEAEFAAADVSKPENEAKIQEIMQACFTENVPVVETPAPTSAADTTKTAEPAK